MLIAIIIFVVMGGLGAFLILWGWLWVQGGKALKTSYETLAQRGEVVDAEVVNRRTNIGRYVSYHVTVRFSVPMPDGTSKSFSKDVTVRGSDYRNMELGTKTRVRYLPEKPDSWKLEDSQEMFSPNVMRMNGLIAEGAGVFVVVAGLVIGFMTLDPNSSFNSSSATSTAWTLQRTWTPNVAQKTSTAIVATGTAEADIANVAKLRTALEPRIQQWKKDARESKEIHRVLPPETGRGVTAFEIDYGYCGPDLNVFYVYIWQRRDGVDMRYAYQHFWYGYGYIENGEPGTCYPDFFGQVWMRKEGNLGNNWYAILSGIEQRYEK